MSQEIEILKVLSDFVIFLISITIPTYAIAVSLLGPEIEKMREKLKLAKEKLEKELRERTSNLTLEEAEAKAKEFRQKENELNSRVNTLYLRPTVGIPNIFFGLALLVLLVGIYLGSEPFLLWLALSLGFIAIGLFFLASALTKIQKTAIERS